MLHTFSAYKYIKGSEVKKLSASKFVLEAAIEEAIEHLRNYPLDITAVVSDWDNRVHVAFIVENNRLTKITEKDIINVNN